MNVLVCAIVSWTQKIVRVTAYAFFFRWTQNVKCKPNGQWPLDSPFNILGKTKETQMFMCVLIAIAIFHRTFSSAFSRHIFLCTRCQSPKMYFQKLHKEKRKTSGEMSTNMYIAFIKMSTFLVNFYIFVVMFWLLLLWLRRACVRQSVCICSENVRQKTATHIKTHKWFVFFVDVVVPLK